MDIRDEYELIGYICNDLDRAKTTEKAKRLLRSLKNEVDILLEWINEAEEELEKMKKDALQKLEKYENNFGLRKRGK